jgi:hypothetical protein
MARGSCVVLTANPRGVFREGYLATGITPKPGTVLQVDPTVALRGGRHTYKLFDRAADGDRPLGAIWVLCEDRINLGRTIDSAFVAGDFVLMYSPVAGEELNMRFLDIAGTGDDHAAGEVCIIDDGTGLLIATTGTPQTGPFVLIEAVTDPVADSCLWCEYTGY